MIFTKNAQKQTHPSEKGQGAESWVNSQAQYDCKPKCSNLY